MAFVTLPSQGLNYVVQPTDWNAVVGDINALGVGLSSFSSYTYTPGALLANTWTAVNFNSLVDGTGLSRSGSAFVLPVGTWIVGLTFFLSNASGGGQVAVNNSVSTTPSAGGTTWACESASLVASECRLGIYTEVRSPGGATLVQPWIASVNASTPVTTGSLPRLTFSQKFN